MSVVYMKVEDQSTISKDDMQLYYDILEPYVEMTLDQKSAPSVVRYQLVCKKELSGKVGYLYDASPVSAADNMDVFDKMFTTCDITQEVESIFNAQQVSCTCKRFDLFGLHEYGGYYGFFRPDIIEVIHFLQTVVPLQEIKDKRINRIYVTTEMHPSNNIGECFDRQMDRHRAKTTAYVLYN